MKRDLLDDNDERHTLKIIPLGAGQEVGRSCIVIKFKGKTIMLDCGVHPGYNGHGSLPFFDGIEAGEVDLLLITHFHIDHVAALPHFTEKTNFKGRVFMTHPTKAVMQMMLRDFLRVSNISSEDQIYDDKDLAACVAKVEIVDFHQELIHAGIKFTPYNAGHVLGACMYMLEIAGTKILYTGDYSLEDDRHLMAAEIPRASPDVLIVESTYGVQVHQSASEREARFTSQVEAVVRRGGRCLLPVFALGRTQELLLILDEHWAHHPELHGIPIYFASKLAAKALRVYQTYINMMNASIRKQIAISNPFQFSHICNLKSLGDFDDSGPCVVMASPGMLQSGVSRELFERWCSDKKNACLIPGYVVEGTLAKKILSEPKEISAADGRILPLNCTVEYISFSAHADFVGTSTFIETIQPPHIVLVHGEKSEMGRLKAALVKKFSASATYSPSVAMPANMEELSFEFKGEKMAKAIGSLAAIPVLHEAPLAALLIEHDFQSHVLVPEDVETFTQIVSSSVVQILYVPFYVAFSVLCETLSSLFTLTDTSDTHCVLSTSVSVTLETSQASPRLKVEWTASPMADMLADSVVTVALSSSASLGGFTASQQPTAKCCHAKTSKPSTTFVEATPSTMEHETHRAMEMDTIKVKEETTETPCETDTFSVSKTTSMATSEASTPWVTSEDASRPKESSESSPSTSLTSTSLSSVVTPLVMTKASLDAQHASAEEAQDQALSYLIMTQLFTARFNTRVMTLKGAIVTLGAAEESTSREIPQNTKDTEDLERPLATVDLAALKVLMCRNEVMRGPLNEVCEFLRDAVEPLVL